MLVQKTHLSQTSQWFAIATRSRAEKKIAERLARNNWHTYLLILWDLSQEKNNATKITDHRILSRRCAQDLKCIDTLLLKHLFYHFAPSLRGILLQEYYV